MSDINADDELNRCRRVTCRQPNKPDWNGWTLGERDGVWIAVRPDAAKDTRAIVHSFHIHPEAASLPESGPVRFTIDIPPTTNHYLTTFVNKKGQIIVQKTQEAHNYIAGARRAMNLARVKPFAGDVSVCLEVYRKANGKQGGDVDNFAKVVCDSMSGYAYGDDQQIAELIIRRHNPPTGRTKAAIAARDDWEPRIEVSISKMDWNKEIKWTKTKKRILRKRRPTPKRMPMPSKPSANNGCLTPLDTRKTKCAPPRKAQDARSASRGAMADRALSLAI